MSSAIRFKKKHHLKLSIITTKINNMYLHQGPVCKEGCIATCSKGKGSCPEGYYGGWGCNGCQYNDSDEYVAENGEDDFVPDIFKKDLGNVKLHFDVEKLREVIQEAKKNVKFTQYQIMEYVMGWATDGQHWFDIDDIKSILHNSLNMLEDGQDGIKATFERRGRDD